MNTAIDNRPAELLEPGHFTEELLEESLGFMLNVAARQMKRLLVQRLNEYGLTATQYVTLCMAAGFTSSATCGTCGFSATTSKMPSGGYGSWFSIFSRD